MKLKPHEKLSLTINTLLVLGSLLFFILSLTHGHQVLESPQVPKEDVILQPMDYFSSAKAADTRTNKITVPSHSSNGRKIKPANKSQMTQRSAFSDSLTTLTSVLYLDSNVFTPTIWQLSDGQNFLQQESGDSGKIFLRSKEGVLAERDSLGNWSTTDCSKSLEAFKELVNYMLERK